MRSVCGPQIGADGDPPADASHQDPHLARRAPRSRQLQHHHVTAPPPGSSASAAAPYRLCSSIAHSPAPNPIWIRDGFAVSCSAGGSHTARLTANDGSSTSHHVDVAAHATFAEASHCASRMVRSILLPRIGRHSDHRPPATTNPGACTPVPGCTASRVSCGMIRGRRQPNLGQQFQLWHTSRIPRGVPASRRVQIANPLGTSPSFVSGVRGSDRVRRQASRSGSSQSGTACPRQIHQPHRRTRPAAGSGTAGSSVCLLRQSPGHTRTPHTPSGRTDRLARPRRAFCPVIARGVLQLMLPAGSSRPQTMYQVPFSVPGTSARNSASASSPDSGSYYRPRKSSYPSATKAPAPPHVSPQSYSAGSRPCAIAHTQPSALHQHVAPARRPPPAPARPSRRVRPAIPASALGLLYRHSQRSYSAFVFRFSACGGG